MLTIEQVRKLAQVEAGPSVSVYIETHLTWPDTCKDRISLKNGLDEAEARLVDAGTAPEEAAGLLAEARELLDDEDFWRYQANGLAVFAMPGETKVLKLPLKVAPSVHVGVRCHVKPLLPLFAGNGRFYVLTIAQDNVQLFEGSRDSIRPADSKEIPSSIEAERHMTSFQDKTGFHPTGPTPSTGGAPTPKIHAGGESAQDVRENVLREWVRNVAEGTEAALKNETAPLVVMADERNLGPFRQFCAYPHMLDEALSEHPEHFDEKEIHDRAWPLVEPVFDERIRNAQAHFESLAGDSKAARTQTDVGEIVADARHGRIEVLFVADDREVPGAVDPETGKGQPHAKPDALDEDLLDRAACEALLTGATVYALPGERIPVNGNIAAILRY